MKLQRSSNGESIMLATGTPLGVGGEARVFPVFNAPHLAAKVYHRPVAERTAKLEAMLANPPEDPATAQGHVSIAWPSDLLLGGGKVVGFLMPRVRAMKPIIDFYLPKTRRQKHPFFSYLYLLRTARNLASCVSALHARGYVVGDLNESNILVDERALVTLVDTDSFQVPDLKTGKIYRCRVGKAEFTPPELQKVSFAWVDRKPENDLFALAVLTFQLLMEGVHPFAGRHIGLGEPFPLEERIAKGWFPYTPALRPGSLPVPTAPGFDLLAPGIRELFVQCFVEGHLAPERRPDAQTWQQALDWAEKSLATCSANDQHLFGAHLGSCPWCERRQLLGGIDPFPSRQEVERLQFPRSWRPVRTLKPRPQGTAPLDYDTAVKIALADIQRQQLVRLVAALGASILVLILFVYWAWAITLALGG